MSTDDAVAAYPRSPRSPERTSASILHADLDAFYASVEQRDDPSLRGRPVVVGGGVVLACSYEAKRLGIRTAMGGHQARRICPDLAVVPPRFEAYSAASKAVFGIFRDTTPLVEGISIDEAFLDVGGLRRVSGTPTDIAAELRRRVAAEVGLRITVGVARTKFLAKVASGVAKPDGLLVVAPAEEISFLHPLAVERLWGVGKVMSAKLHAIGLHTVGQVAALDPATLTSILGAGNGRALHALAHNRDPRAVQVGRRRRSIGAQHALGRGTKSPADIDAIMIGLVERVARRMRAASRQGRTVVLRLRFDDFSRATRSRTLVEPTDHTGTILGAVRSLLVASRPMIRDRGLTMVGLSVANFDGQGVQPELPFDEPGNPVLDAALDDVRRKFGSSVLTRAVLLGRDPGISMPMLPD